MRSPEFTRRGRRGRRRAGRTSYLASRIYQERTGKNLFDAVDLVEYPELGPLWDFDDEAEMKQRYPKLVAKMGL